MGWQDYNEESNARVTFTFPMVYVMAGADGPVFFSEEEKIPGFVKGVAFAGAKRIPGYVANELEALLLGVRSRWVAKGERATADRSNDKQRSQRQGLFMLTKGAAPIVITSKGIASGSLTGALRICNGWATQIMARTGKLPPTFALPLRLVPKLEERKSEDFTWTGREFTAFPARTGPPDIMGATDEEFSPAAELWRNIGRIWFQRWQESREEEIEEPAEEITPEEELERARAKWGRAEGRRSAEDIRREAYQEAEERDAGATGQEQRAPEGSSEASSSKRKGKSSKGWNTDDF